MLMAGELEPKREVLLKTLCRGAVASLAARLREGMAKESYQQDLVAAAGLYALAALNEVGEVDSVEQFTAGDITVRTGKSDKASDCLRRQAQWLIAPYLKDTFAFQEV